MTFSSNDLQNSFIFTAVPEFIDPVFAKTRPKRSFSVIKNDDENWVYKFGHRLLVNAQGPTSAPTSTQKLAVSAFTTRMYSCSLLSKLTGRHSIITQFKGAFS